MLVLPYPPSVNHYWRHVRGRTLISQEGRAYRQRVCALLADPAMGGPGPRKPPSGGRVALDMDVFPPDRRRRDLDNLQKAVLDSLGHGGVYKDDSQIDLLITRRCGITPGGRIEVGVHDLPLRRCPLCGAPEAAVNPEHN